MGFGYTERGFVMPRYKTVTASGNPVKLEAAKRLRQLTIYGNAVQNGTPTPDTPVDIQLCGDATGNLCPVSKNTDAANATNFSLETPVVEGETYTFSFVADSVSEGHTGVGMHLRLGSQTGTSQIPGFTCPIGNRYVSSFTATGSGTLFVNGYWTQSFSQIQVLKGAYTAETIPAYEPYGYKVSGRVEGDGEPPQDFAVYLPQQIAKVGDVADEVVVDFEKRTAELVRRTKEIVFDGTENWTTGTNVSDIKDHYSYIASIFSNRVNCFSNRYTVAYSSYDHCTYMSGNNPVLLRIADNSFATAAEFKAWLSELYASGEPLKYLFELAAPVTTDITAMQDWDAMPQVKGTVTLTLSAEVEPSGAEAVYISSRSPKPKAQTISDVVINEADPEHTEASEQEQADEAAALNIEMITYE